MPAILATRGARVFPRLKIAFQSCRSCRADIGWVRRTGTVKREMELMPPEINRERVVPAIPRIWGVVVFDIVEDY